MGVHLVGGGPRAVLDIPSRCAFHAVLRVAGEGGGQPLPPGRPSQRRAAAVRQLAQARVQCPRRGEIAGSECVDCEHLMAWRVTPDVRLYCTAADDDPVRDWMHAPPTAAPDTPCPVADRDAAVAGLHHMLVLDAERRLAGIACRCDLGRGGAAPVSAVMGSEVFAVVPGTTLGVAATAMRRLSIGCLPVIAGELVVGVITRRDLLRAGVPGEFFA